MMSCWFSPVKDISFKDFLNVMQKHRTFQEKLTMLKVNSMNIRFNNRRFDFFPEKLCYFCFVLSAWLGREAPNTTIPMSLGHCCYWEQTTAPSPPKFIQKIWKWVKVERMDVSSGFWQRFQLVLRASSKVIKWWFLSEMHHKWLLSSCF